MAGANAINLRAKSYARLTAQNVGFIKFRIKTSSRTVTEVQPAVGRSVRRKRKLAVMGQNFGEVKRLFLFCKGEVCPEGAG